MSTGTLPDLMGITITEMSPQRVVGTMPVKGNTQPFGLLHGGASCVLAESLGSLGASAHAAELFGGIALGVDISATHHRSARSGIVTGVATPLHLGRSVATLRDRDHRRERRPHLHGPPDLHYCARSKCKPTA